MQFALKNRKALVLLLIFSLLFMVMVAIQPVTKAEASVYGKVGTSTTTVKFIEGMLSYLGYNVGTVDYRYDENTAEGVKAFQRDAGLPVTGIVDTATYKQLYISCQKGEVIPVNQPAPQPQPQPAPQPQPTPQPTPTPSPQFTQLTAEEQTLLNLINTERTNRGLQPFQVDMRLVGTARAKAQEMADNNYFSHTSPALGTPYEQMRNAGITGYYMLGAENIAFARSVQLIIISCTAPATKETCLTHGTPILVSALSTVVIGAKSWYSILPVSNLWRWTDEIHSLGSQRQ